MDSHLKDGYESSENANCSAARRLLEFNCLRQYAELEKELLTRGVSFCATAWDSASCWAPTEAGLNAVVACPTEYFAVHYDTNINATRFCEGNGTWANKSNYDTCMNNGSDLDSIHTEASEIAGILGVYYIGYTVSLVSSCVALWLFLYFRTLHCLRNTLHCNLIITYILLDLTWIIMTTVFITESDRVEDLPHSAVDEFRYDCRIFEAIFTYFQVTNFFWMLVESLYIILIIFRTHKLEMLYYWPFAIIGWGLPVVVIIVWVVMKVLYDNAQCWFDAPSSKYSFFYIGPILLVLAINVIFLITIMQVLLRKYRNTITTAASTRRTAKSFFILLPLLGLSYVLILVIPEEPKIVKLVLKYITAVFTSMQGFFVSLLYCFLNNEVRSIVRLRGNSFFPYRTWLKLDSSSMRRSPRTLSSSADNHSMNEVAAGKIIQEPPALSRYRQNENLRQLQINIVTANKNELAYLLKEKEYQDRIQKQIRHQALGYRSTVF